MTSVLWTTDYEDGDPALIGKTPAAMNLSSDKETLTINFTDKSAVRLECEGDCCSSTWIEHIGGVKQFVGHQITAVETVPMPGDLGDGEDEHGQHHECLRYYGLKIRTTGGELFIEYRNSSNGYYGGSLRVRDGLSTQEIGSLLTADV